MAEKLRDELSTELNTAQELLKTLSTETEEDPIFTIQPVHTSLLKTLDNQVGADFPMLLWLNISV